jgi:hypothetical protein
VIRKRKTGIMDTELYQVKEKCDENKRERDDNDVNDRTIVCIMKEGIVA